MLYYEFGYTIHSNGETQETILGVCPEKENEKDKKQRRIKMKYISNIYNPARPDAKSHFCYTSFDYRQQKKEWEE